MVYRETQLEPLFYDDLGEILDSKRAMLFSSYFDQSSMQESWRFRALFYARRVSEYLITPQGKFDLDRCLHLGKIWQRKKYILAPFPEDQEIFSHIERILLFFLQNKDAREKISRFDRLLLSEKKREWILASLHEMGKIDDSSVRKSILTALFTPLRQNIGSCFATAPCIYIQRYYPDLLLDDLYELLYVGRLERVIDGIDYLIPMNPSIGSLELKKPFRHLDFFKIAKNPALHAALESIDILDEESTHSSKEKELVALMHEKSFSTPQELIRQIVKEKNSSFTKPDPDRRLFIPHSPIPLSSAEEKKLERAFLYFTASTDHPLLKMWEYTIASMSDVKQRFTTWNLFQSLGLDPKEEIKDGLLSFWKRELRQKMEEEAKKMEAVEVEYQQTYDKVKTAYTLSLQESREQRSSQAYAEWQMMKNSLSTLGDLLAKGKEKLEGYSNLPAFLTEKSIALFPEYFQELYDPDIEEIENEMLYDSPAGFRLYYKHGRSEPTLWSPIRNDKEFQNLLRDFINSLERECETEMPWKSVEKEMRDLFTQTHLFIQSDQFIPDKRKGKKTTPWSYISGGTMEDLLSVYFGKGKNFTKLTSKSSGGEELISFLGNLEKSPMLMTSLHHAFIYRGDILQIKGAEELSTLSSYFYQQISLNQEEQDCLIDLLIKEYSLSMIPKEILSTHSYSSVPLLSEHLGAIFSKLFPGKGEKLIDKFLFSHLPLSHSEKLKNFFVPFSMEEIAAPFLQRKKFFSSSEFISLLTYCAAWKKKSLFSNTDLLQTLVDEAKNQLLLYPYSITFAETNWPGKWFSWICPPSSSKVMLWVTDYFGTSGFPMEEKPLKKNEGWIAYMEKKEMGSFL